MDVQKANRIRDLLDQRDGLDEELDRLMKGGELGTEAEPAAAKKKGRPPGTKNKQKENDDPKEERHQLALVPPVTAEV